MVLPVTTAWQQLILWNETQKWPYLVAQMDQGTITGFNFSVKHPGHDFRLVS